jgi:CRP/FNR family putative post-exponential-phase nitrogen-starvation transcriptional regulator
LCYIQTQEEGNTGKREEDILKILHDPVQKERLIQTHKLADYMTLDIHEISNLVCFARNEYLVTAGVPSDYLYFVMSGKTICFSYTTNEKNNCVSFTQHQTLVGEASSLFGKPPTFNVKALSDTVCIAINLPRYRTALLNTTNHLFTLQLTDCADALNTSYRHLLRIMKQLCALNILSKEHNCYYIQDRDALERVSSGELLIYE